MFALMIFKGLLSSGLFDVYPILRALLSLQNLFFFLGFGEFLLLRKKGVILGSVACGRLIMAIGGCV